MRKFFVTGTDTNIGKTYITLEMIKFFTRQNLRVVGIKPVASGCYQYKGLLLNEDALLLQAHSTVTIPYHKINPFSFEPPIAPHIADKKGILTTEEIYSKYKDILTEDLDMLFVEGVGGWCVPINKKETMADFVKKADLDVIVVVGMRLGCLNHSILTVESILARSVRVSGWIANCFDTEMESLSENIESLKEILQIPFLGKLDSGTITDGSDLASSLMMFREGGLSA
ncbi:MAG: dethiobiotin synthase [Rickettsiales bacterium]|nr:dethiobiotin synthase [Rickettsiales bacterium]